MQITEITPVKQQSDKPIQLAAYCRVSSDSEDQLHSFATQIRYYSEYEKRHPEYTLVDIYADEGLTGTDMKKRDELNRLIYDCKKGKIERVIVKSISRFARNTEELLTTIRLLKSIGVSIYFEEQGIDTNKLNVEMIVTFPGMAAQQESMSISGNMRWSYQKRMDLGVFNCCAPAYGYSLIDGQLVPKEEEMQVVRRIFSLYLQGVGTQNIANLLNEKGIPRRYSQKKWYDTTIQYILTNERYMGDALLQKSFTTETLPFRKVRNKGQLMQYYVENSNPALVEKDTYKAAQELMHSRASNKGCKRKPAPLTGKLRCPECDMVFRRQLTNGTVYWLCRGKSAGRTNCRYRRVRQDTVYDTFMMMADKLADNRKELLDPLIHQIVTMQEKTSAIQDKVRQIDKEIADLAAQNLVITRLHTSGILPAAEYTAQAAEISSKITALRVERKKKLSEDEDDAWLESLRELSDILEKTEPTIEFDAELFGQIVKSITVDDCTQLTFHLLGGVKLTEKIGEKGWCRSA